MEKEERQECYVFALSGLLNENSTKMTRTLIFSILFTHSMLLFFLLVSAELKVGKDFLVLKNR